MSVGAFTGVTAAVALQGGTVSSGPVRLHRGAWSWAPSSPPWWASSSASPCCGCRGDYLAIVTLAFGEIIKSIFNNLYVGVDGSGLHVSLLSDTTNLAERR